MSPTSYPNPSSTDWNPRLRPQDRGGRHMLGVFMCREGVCVSVCVDGALVHRQTALCAHGQCLPG